MRAAEPGWDEANDERYDEPYMATNNNNEKFDFNLHMEPDSCMDAAMRTACDGETYITLHLGHSVTVFMSPGQLEALRVVEVVNETTEAQANAL